MRLMKTCAALIVTLLVVVALIGTFTTASAQNSGNPSILAAVQALQSSVNAVLATLAPGNTRFTPAVAVFPPDEVYCPATNVSDASRTVTIEVINAGSGTVIGHNGASGATVNPNRFTSLGITLASGIKVFCKFTVVDGVKTDIRGAINIFASSTTSDKLVVPAE